MRATPGRSMHWRPAIAGCQKVVQYASSCRPALVLISTIISGGNAMGPGDEFSEFEVDAEELKKQFWGDAETAEPAGEAEQGAKPNGHDPDPWPVLDEAAR